MFAPVDGPLLLTSGAPFSLHSQRGPAFSEMNPNTLTAILARFTHFVSPAPLTLLTDCCCRLFVAVDQNPQTLNDSLLHDRSLMCPVTGSRSGRCSHTCPAFSSRRGMGKHPPRSSPSGPGSSSLRSAVNMMNPFGPTVSNLTGPEKTVTKHHRGPLDYPEFHRSSAKNFS